MAPEPPWVVFPAADPTWGGWRQGAGELWLREQWLPFWSACDARARAAYLVANPPPSEEWRMYLEDLW